MNRRRFLHNLSLSSFGLLAGSLLTACAAGNFGLTRQLGGWNRKFSIIPRVLIYIVLIIIPAYELTLLFDFILNNTIEFWTGSALTQAKTETFEKDGQRVEVAHSRSPLRRSIFTHYDSSGQVQSTSEMRETETGMVDVYVNGEKKAQLKSLSEGLAEISAFRGGSLAKKFVVRENFIDIAAVRSQVYPNSVIAAR